MVAYAQLTSAEIKHIEVVIANPALASSPEHVLPHITKIMQAYGQIEEDITHELGLYDSKNRRKHKNLIRAYLEKIASSNSLDVVKQVFSLTNSWSSEDAAAGWFFINGLMEAAASRNPHFYSEFERQVLTVEKGPLLTPNFFLAINMGLSYFSFPPLSLKAKALIFKTLRDNIHALPETVEYELADAAAFSVQNLRDVQVKEVQLLLGFWERDYIEEKLGNRLADSINELYQKQSSLYSTVLIALKSNKITTDAKVRLLELTYGETYWETLLNQLSSDRKVMAQIARDAKKSTSVFTGLLKSNSFNLRLVAMEYAFTLAVVFGVKDSKLIGQLEQQLMHKNFEVRARARELYAAAVDVDPAFHEILKAPHNTKILMPRNTVISCYRLLRKVFRKKSELSVAWRDAKDKVTR